MPIYEYYCEACGHEFETMQKITEAPITECESCGKPKAKRSISRTSFVLKGSGWYVTDYGGKNASQGPNAAASGEKDGAGKSAEKATGESKSTKKAANA